MPTYLLKTTIPGDKPTTRERIVEAKNQAQAIRHVTRDTISCDEVSVADAMRLAESGVKLEQALVE
jgi:hypothetical protein